MDTLGILSEAHFFILCTTEWSLMLNMICDQGSNEVSGYGAADDPNIQWRNLFHQIQTQT